MCAFRTRVHAVLMLNAYVFPLLLLWPRSVAQGLDRQCRVAAASTHFCDLHSFNGDRFIHQQTNRKDHQTYLPAPSSAVRDPEVPFIQPLAAAMAGCRPGCHCWGDNVHYYSDHKLQLLMAILLACLHGIARGSVSREPKRS